METINVVGNLLEIKESLIIEAKKMTRRILNNLNGAGLYGVEVFL